MEITVVNPKRVRRESYHHLVFPIGCVYHGLRLLLEVNLVKLLVHFDCSLAQFSALAMLIYERARELEKVFKVPFGYREIIRYFFFTPVRNGTLFRVDFFKKKTTPIGLPQNYSSWQARWFQAEGPWDKSGPGLIPTEDRVQVSTCRWKSVPNKHAE